MALQKLNITGPLFQYTMNDARIIQEYFNSYDPKDEVEITWHCPGGDIREGNKIFDIIMQHPGPTTSRILLAASAGSYAATAADRMIVYDFSEFMIHQAHMFGYFDLHRGMIDEFVAEMQKQKATLEQLDSTIANIYAKRCGIEHAKIMDWMVNETTWRGEDIHKVGFATEFADTPARDMDKEFTNLAEAQFDLSCYANHDKSRWHKTYGPGIQAQEAWYAQTAALLNVASTPTEKPTDTTATITNHVETNNDSETEAVRLARIAQARRKMEKLALERLKVLGK